MRRHYSGDLDPLQVFDSAAHVLKEAMVVMAVVASVVRAAQHTGFRQRSDVTPLLRLVPLNRCPPLRRLRGPDKPGAARRARCTTARIHP
jgi:hypothetical protein